MDNNIINKVTESGLITIDLSDLHVKGERVLLDIRPLLIEDLLLREKDFREYIKTTNWSAYKDKLVAVTCTSDAIIPVWAYMLLAASLEPFAAKVVLGDLQQLEKTLYLERIVSFDTEKYRDQRIVIKGCGDIEVPSDAFLALTAKLRPVVKSIFYGEPCSTVPVYKAR